MRRFKNPVYAIESLERKLSPSSIVAVPVAVQVYVPGSVPISTSPIDPAASPSADTTSTSTPTTTSDPAPPPNPNPLSPPDTTNGPALPC